MMKVKCPNPKCEKFVLDVLGEEAVPILTTYNDIAQRSKQQVYLLYCTSCGQYLGVVNKQD